MATVGKSDGGAVKITEILRVYMKTPGIATAIPGVMLLLVQQQVPVGNTAGKPITQKCQGQA